MLVFKMVRCYYCGKEFKDEASIVMKEINVGFLELQTTRQPFHPECFKMWKREKRITMIKQLSAIFIAFGLFLLALHLLFGHP